MNADLLPGFAIILVVLVLLAGIMLGALVVGALWLVV